MITYHMNDDGETTREVFTDTTPDWQKHLDGAGMLTVEGFLALHQDMRLDEIERRDPL